MSAVFFGLCIFIWFVMFALGIVVDGALSDTSTFDAVLNMDIISMESVGLGWYSIPVPMLNVDFLKGVLDLATWNFSMLSNYGMEWVRWAFWSPITGMIVWGTATTLGPLFIAAATAIASIVQTIASFMSALNPLTLLRRIF